MTAGEPSYATAACPHQQALANYNYAAWKWPTALSFGTGSTGVLCFVVVRLVYVYTWFGSNVLMSVAPAPPECSSGGTGVPPPTRGRVPAVPIGSDDAPFDVCGPQYNHGFNWFMLCVGNVGYVVFFLLTVLVMIPWSPPKPPPWTDPTNATTCPFDVVACNRQCALMHVNCTESNRLHASWQEEQKQRRLAGKKNKKNKRPNCDLLHGAETASWSSAAFDSVQEKRAHLESLDWEHEPALWGLRKERIGDSRCDRGGCGLQLCECNFEGGDCPQPSVGNPYIWALVLWFFCSVIYLVSVCTAFGKLIHLHLNAPKLRDEGDLTAYVEKMQRAQPQVSFSVVCSHMSGGSRGKHSHTGTGGKPKPVVTHCSSHPFTYATCTDKSNLTKNWQQPTGGGIGEGGSLGTGFVAVVSSKLKWSAAKGATADLITAEKERLRLENKDRDKKCSVTVKVNLPGHLPNQLYAPANPKRLPPVADWILVFLGLGAPLFFWYRRRLTRRIAHTVHKTIYIEGHAAPAGA